MSDRFDITFDHKVDTKPDGCDVGAGARSARRVEVITGAGRRRDWSTDEKARILFESLVPGANVSAVARRHGMSPQQLFGWRKTAREEMAADAQAKPSSDRCGPSRPTAPGFVPVRIAATLPTASALLVPPSPPPPAAPCAGLIEIVIGECIVRVSGTIEAPSLSATLATVLAAVRRSR
jgi:transposase